MQLFTLSNSACYSVGGELSYWRHRSCFSEATLLYMTAVMFSEEINVLLFVLGCDVSKWRLHLFCFMLSEADVLSVLSSWPTVVKPSELCFVMFSCLCFGSYSCDIWWSFICCSTFTWQSFHKVSMICQLAVQNNASFIFRLAAPPPHHYSRPTLNTISSSEYNLTELLN